MITAGRSLQPGLTGLLPIELLGVWPMALGPSLLVHEPIWTQELGFSSTSSQMLRVCERRAGRCWRPGSSSATCWTLVTPRDACSVARHWPYLSSPFFHPFSPAPPCLLSFLSYSFRPPPSPPQPQGLPQAVRPITELVCGGDETGTLLDSL